MGEWISVKNGLPDEHQIVDILDHDSRWTDIEFYDNNFFSAEQDFSVDDDGYGCFTNTHLVENVLYWMPAPAHPEKIVRG